jgi:hypothetical protein
VETGAATTAARSGVAVAARRAVAVAVGTGAALSRGFGFSAARASARCGGVGGPCSISAGALTAPPASTTTVPALASVAAVPAPPAPAASQVATGIGTTAVAAARTDTRARCTS